MLDHLLELDLVAVRVVALVYDVGRCGRPDGQRGGGAFGPLRLVDRVDARSRHVRLLHCSLTNAARYSERGERETVTEREREREVHQSVCSLGS